MHSLHTQLFDAMSIPPRYPSRPVFHSHHNSPRKDKSPTAIRLLGPKLDKVPARSLRNGDVIWTDFKLDLLGLTSQNGIGSTTRKK